MRRCEYIWVKDGHCTPGLGRYRQVVCRNSMLGPENREDGSYRFRVQSFR